MHRTESGWVVEWVLRGADGKEIELPLRPDQSLTIGRDLTSDISLVDAGISRHHALISLEEGGLWIEDLHSQNGTFVNMECAHRVPLQEGDLITFGRLHLTLLSRKRRQTRGVELLRPLSSSALAQLLRISRRLTAAQDPTTIFTRALDAVLDSLSADRGVVLLWEPQEEGFHPVAAYPSEGFRELDHLAQESALQAVMQSGKVQVVHRNQSGFRASQDLEAALEYPAALVPIFAWQKPLGIIYLDRHLQSAAFEQPEIDFLAAFAWISEGIFGFSRHTCDLIASNERLEARTRFTPKREERSAGLVERPYALNDATNLDTVLSELITELSRVRQRLQQAEKPRSRQEALNKIRRLTLYSQASRLLWIHPQTSRDVVDLEEIAREAFASSYIGQDRWSLHADCTFKVLAPAETLVIAMRLLAEVALNGDADSANHERPSPFLRISAEARKQWLLIMIHPSLQPTESNAMRGKLPRELDLPFELARKLVSSRLAGRLKRREVDGRIDLELPIGTGALDETIVL